MVRVRFRVRLRVMFRVRFRVQAGRGRVLLKKTNHEFGSIKCNEKTDRLAAERTCGPSIFTQHGDRHGWRVCAATGNVVACKVTYEETKGSFQMIKFLNFQDMTMNINVETEASTWLRTCLEQK